MALSIGELVGYVGLDTGPAEDAAGKITGVFDKMGGTWAKVLGGAAAAAGGAVAAGLVGAMSAEVGSDMLAASLGKSSRAAERYGDLAGRVYSNGFGEGLEDVNTAIGAVVSSIGGMRKASAADVEKMTEKAMTFADVMGVDVTRAAQVAGVMINAGLAKNGSQAFDLLMKASQKVPAALREDVMDATEEYGQFFTQLGIDGPAAMDILAKGAEKGMYGIDKAGDAVKEFTIRATDMSTASKDAYKKIGLNARQMSNDILAGGDKAGKATGKILKGLLSLPPGAKQANAAIALFGTPLEDLSTKDIPKFLASLQGSEKGLGKWRGSVEKAGKTAYDNASTNLTMFGRSLKTNFVEMIGGSVLPKVNELAASLSTGLGPAVSAVVGFLSEHKTAAKVLAGVLAALVTVTAAHSAVLAVSAAGGMAAWLKGTKLISAATKVWTAVQWAMNAALSANPIGIVIALIAALVVGAVIAYKKSETFRKVVDAALRAVGVAGKWMWNTALKPAFAAMKVAIDAVGKAGKWLWNNALQPAFKFIAKGIAVLLAAWADMLRALGNVPGFGWAKGAADAMDRAAGKALDIANNIKKIPTSKDVAVNVKYSYSGLKDPTRGRGGIPGLATGGRVTGATLAVIGEGREPESVLPDSVLRGLLERAHNAGRDSARDNGRSGPLIDKVIQQPGESADVLAERLWFKTRTRG